MIVFFQILCVHNKGRSLGETKHKKGEGHSVDKQIAIQLMKTGKRFLRQSTSRKKLTFTNVLDASQTKVGRSFLQERHFACSFCRINLTRAGCKQLRHWISATGSHLAHSTCNKLKITSSMKRCHRFVTSFAEIRCAKLSPNLLSFRTVHIFSTWASTAASRGREGVSSSFVALHLPWLKRARGREKARGRQISETILFSPCRYCLSQCKIGSVHRLQR